MFSHHLGRALAIASAVLLSACRTFTPDGGMETVASVAGSGLSKNVVRINSPEDAALAHHEVARLLHAPLSVEAAVQIALLNSPGLQAAYNRLGVAEAVMVQMSRPPLPSFAFDRVSTSIELDVERQIVASIFSLATWPSRSKIAGVRFEQAELRAAKETLRLAAETRRAYIQAVAARQIVAALDAAQSSANASAMLAEKLTQTGAINKLDLARRQVFATELEAQVAAARQAAATTRERLTRLMGLWGGSDLDGLLPNALPAMPAKAWSLAAVERAAMERRVELAVARLEIEALARSYGLTRATRFVNVLDLGGISKTQKDKGEPSAAGGGFTIAFEVPLYDFGRARVREAEQRYLESVNSLRALAVDARSQAREAHGAYSSARAIVAKYEGEVLPLRDSISAEVELQYNAMQVDAFALLEAARAKATAKVASIEAKRSFWLAAADLSAAVLGGGGLSQEGVTFAAADAGASAAH